MLLLINKFIAAAENDNQWMQLVFFIAILLFSSISAIVKALAKKAGKEKEQPALQQRGEKTFKPFAPARPKTMVIKHPPEKPRFRSLPTAPVVQEQAEFEEEKLPEVQKLTVKEEISSSSKALIKLDSASEIRRAIVYYEILGKPLSLRDYPFFE
jgi:hypothetical protein